MAEAVKPTDDALVLAILLAPPDFTEGVTADRVAGNRCHDMQNELEERFLRDEDESDG